jgi:GH15 family glucan-1,4-alpha-glucosidase
MKDGYPLIEDHGLIGDLQTSALVSTEGSIDWFCAPRFDSPSVFGALLDKEKGGYCRIRPTTDAFTTKQLYFPDTAVLVTRYLTEEGVGEVIDFMPVTSSEVPAHHHRIVRMLRCIRGQMTFDIEIAPRFDYGRESHETRISEGGVVFRGTGTTMAVSIVREPEDEELARGATDEEGDIRVELTLRTGQARGMILDIGSSEARETSVEEVWELFNGTVQFWTTWLEQSTYTGRWREMVNRSAITLKLMTYAPSGGLVAAPTAALPEQIGGERNWDYRFTWVRDASFSVYALLALGFMDEAVAFGVWMRERVMDTEVDGRPPLNIMYRVDGSSDLSEESLEHWAGYRNSFPVRIGNGAADQLQLDIYGEMMDSLYLADQRGLQMNYAGWLKVCGVLDWLADHWDQPEEGIWETRGGRQHFTYGRLMSWVAFDRGIRLSAKRGWPASTEAWASARDAVFRQIMEKGWSADRQAFVQHYDTQVLDASLLRMAALGFISPTDPMWQSTLDAMDEELVTDSLVYRYDPEASPDGLRGSEGTFSLCTFTYVEALAEAGRLDKARITFEKMLTYANHLGLYSEEIALNGDQIGNFPQAFTHLALINAAIRLDGELSRRAERR